MSLIGVLVSGGLGRSFGWGGRKFSLRLVGSGAADGVVKFASVCLDSPSVVCLVGSWLALCA
jgi:hypothetical protein